MLLFNRALIYIDEEANKDEALAGTKIALILTVWVFSQPTERLHKSCNLDILVERAELDLLNQNLEFCNMGAYGDQSIQDVQYQGDAWDWETQSFVE